MVGMGKWLLCFPLKLISLILLLFGLCAVDRHDDDGLMMSSSNAGSTLIDVIYQFGDSVSDTGNLMRENRSSLCTTFPYGETYFHYATGRCSDGLIMSDFYAKAFGLQFLHPYLEKGANFNDGVNFAVGGATALNVSFLESMDIYISDTNSSLSVQLHWFQDYLNSTCSSITECKSKLKRSLILMETIGGNDYLNAFRQWGFTKADELVPYVVQAIIDVVKEMLVMGAVNVVVPGAFPSGCMPSYLTMSNPENPDIYDDLGCLIKYNKFFRHHNQLLQKAVQELQVTYPNVTLMYADYYSAAISLLRNSSSYGFEEGANLVTCCGYGKNPYNFNLSNACGTTGVPVCPHPEKRVSWDGNHFTQHSYMYLSNWMLKNTIIPQLSLISST